MSAESQQTVKRIKEHFERIKRDANELGTQATPLGDKGLVEKIKRASEHAGEVVKHIEERASK